MCYIMNSVDDVADNVMELWMAIDIRLMPLWLFQLKVVIWERAYRFFVQQCSYVSCSFSFLQYSRKKRYRIKHSLYTF